MKANIASALMKSLRGSDPDAAVHYLARLLEAGDLITAIRRLLCSGPFEGPAVLAGLSLTAALFASIMGMETS